MSLHVQDSSLFERKLRPIYDSLEVGNNRKALQETEKVLKKHPNLLCARALKGLALMRLGRYEESQSVLKTVACEKPVDDSTLQVLSFCYKELEQLDKIVDLYNHAVKKTPGNEELLAHLFISHVRLEDFKSQQAVALQLYKTQSKNAYYFWSVMSLVLQATRGPERSQPEKRQLYLALAQRMVDKLLKENKLEGSQEVELYLRILKLQSKDQEALDFLDDERCIKLFPAAPIYTKIDLLKKLEKWQEINSLLKKLLRVECDRWDFYQDYLTSCFKLLQLTEKTEINDNCNDVSAAADNGQVLVLDECHDFICQIIELGNNKFRGPYLARLELHKRMREQQLNAQELLGDFTELILEYFRLFGHKVCCTQDITLFLLSISLEQRHSLANKLLLESGISSKTLPQDKDQMQKHICALQISRICGTHIDLNEEHLLALYSTLKLHYEHGLSNFGKNLLHTDIGPSDNYALLAANVMYDLSRQQQKSDHIFEGLCLLQYVLRNSTSNYYVKLFSLKIYHMFGCLLGAQEMYDYLDIKHIQLDSMGYVHCNALPLCGRFSMARTAFDNTLKFFTNSYKERLEYMALAYRFCTFNKLEEFMQFKERLTNSIHYVAISVEAQLCDLVTLYGNVQQNLSAYSAMSIEPQDDRIAWNELSDNRDLNAIIPWDPVHLVDKEEERKESFAQEVEVLQIRSLMLRLISACVDLFHIPSGFNASKKTQKSAAQTADTLAKENCNANENGAKETDALELLRETWTGLFQRIRLMNYQPLPNRFLNSLLPTRLHLLLVMPYEKFFDDLAQLVLDFYYGSSKLAMQCKTVCDNVSGLLEQCAIVVRESDTEEDGLWRRREWQNRIAACLELMSLYAFVLSVLNEKLQERMNRSKTKKKPAESNNEQAKQTISGKERTQMLSELLRQLKTKLQNTELLIQNWKAPALPRDLNSFMADMSLKPEVEAILIGDVASVFKESHELMITEIRNLLKDKIRMVSK